MKAKKVLAMVLILSGLFVVAKTSYGCYNPPPNVFITSPAGGATFTEGDNVTIKANASDNGYITKVEFYVDGTLLGEGTYNGGLYEYTWNEVPAGSHSLNAKAYDNKGKSAYSSSVIIDVYNPPPTVGIFPPTQCYEFVEGDYIYITAMGTDIYPGRIIRVEFYDETTFIGEASPYSTRRVGLYSLSIIEWTWHNVPHGHHELWARAYDNLGKWGDSDPPVDVVVQHDNPPPSVSITSPADNAVFASGDSIDITATASDALPGYIKRVEFYRDNTVLLGKDATAPYSIKWNARAGNYTLKARAFDSREVWTDAQVNIVVTDVPGGVRRHVDIDCPGGDGLSWTNAYKYLQDALAVAWPGDEIWVAEGTYKPTTGEDPDISFNLKCGVKLYGGFQGVTPPPPGLPDGETQLEQRDWVNNETILSGDLNDDGCGESLRILTGADDAVLDGFTVTKTNLHGVGLYSAAFNLTIANCIFKDNHVLVNWETYNEPCINYNDGAVAIDGGSIAITDCSFTNNSSHGAGGAMVANGGNLTLTNCNFTNNTARGNYVGGVGGGAIAIYRGNVKLTLCQFNENGKNGICPICDSDISGGAIHNRGGGTLSLTNCTFNRNEGVEGGGIYNLGLIQALTKCVFIKNEASDGGAIYNASTNTDGIIKKIRGCTFNGNKAGVWSSRYPDPAWDQHGGGGIFNNGEIRIIINCTFSEQETPGCGGGIYNHGTAILPVVNCTFSRNYSLIMGGGLFNWLHDDYTPPHCDVTLTNCVFWGNYDLNNNTWSDDQVYAVHYDTYGDYYDIVMNYCCIQNMNPPGVGNIWDNPLFVNPDDPDGPDDIFGTSGDGLALSPGSPCIDAGDNSALDSPRARREVADITGINARKIDDPATTPDPGNGTPPIVDIGAYEYYSDGIVPPPEPETITVVNVCIIDESRGQGYEFNSNQYDWDLYNFRNLMYFFDTVDIMKAGCLVPPSVVVGTTQTIEDVLPSGYSAPSDVSIEQIGLPIAEGELYNGVSDHFDRICDGETPDYIILSRDISGSMSYIDINAGNYGWDDFKTWLETTYGASNVYERTFEEEFWLSEMYTALEEATESWGLE